MNHAPGLKQILQCNEVSSYERATTFDVREGQNFEEKVDIGAGGIESMFIKVIII